MRLEKGNHCLVPFRLQQSAEGAELEAVLPNTTLTTPSGHYHFVPGPQGYAATGTRRRWTWQEAALAESRGLPGNI